MRQVLIVDDDVKFFHMLRDFLSPYGIELAARHEGKQGLEAVRSTPYELMLLDVTLPGIDGFEVLQILRQFSDICVILLTARGEAADRVRGLQIGADDYLAKPFVAEELAARIHAILRRGLVATTAKTTPSVRPNLSLDGLTMDFVTRAVSYQDVLLELTNIETALLEMFVQSPGIVLTREELVTRVFQRPFHPLDRSLDVYVSRLRRKLSSSTPLGNYIKTIRSSGYMFSTPQSARHLHARQ